MPTVFEAQVRTFESCWAGQNLPKNYLSKDKTVDGIGFAWASIAVPAC